MITLQCEALTLVGFFKSKMKIYFGFDVSRFYELMIFCVIFNFSKRFVSDSKFLQMRHFLVVGVGGALYFRLPFVGKAVNHSPYAYNSINDKLHFNSNKRVLSGSWVLNCQECILSN